MTHDVFGQTRTDVCARHALLTPDGYVASHVPGWEAATCHIVIAGGMGAKLLQWFATFEAAGSASGNTTNRSLFVYVLKGSLRIDKEKLGPGGYAYLPPGRAYTAKATRGTRLLFFEKRFEPLTDEAVPDTLFGQQTDVPGEAFMGDPDARLQTLLPNIPAFDMAVNIFTYQPGATLPFVETHIMEHGLLMLSGQGVYRLDDRYYPVKEGDVIWMAPWCPQWYVGMGKTPSSYIYYKDVNRYPTPAL